MFNLDVHCPPAILVFSLQRIRFGKLKPLMVRASSETEDVIISRPRQEMLGWADLYFCSPPSLCKLVS
jgi:hypothetical protein